PGQPNPHQRDGFPSEFRVVEQGSKSQERADTEDNKRESLAGPAQLGDNRSDHAQEDERLALLEVGKRIRERRTAGMPRDRPRTADSQTETEEEPQNEFWMPELFDAVLNRQPGITLGVSGPHIGHLFRRVSTQRCRRQHTHKDNDSGG